MICGKEVMVACWLQREKQGEEVSQDHILRFYDLGLGV
jgi:hypothetical protein